MKDIKKLTWKEFPHVLDKIFPEVRDPNRPIVNISLFEEMPVSFREFVEGADHMAFPPLSPRQYAVADFMFDGEIDKIFDNQNSLACLVWGKGSGKDSLAVLMLLYAIYWCMCLKDPQRFFHMPSGEWLDCLNVAYSARLAASIFFEKLKQRVLRWVWLRRKYTVKSSGVYISQFKSEAAAKVGKGAVIITRDGIIFPKLLRIVSGNSQQESFEGANLLCWILDEASAFRDKTKTHNGDKIYKMMRSSATSRFGSRWKGFIISYPREKDDFTLRMHDMLRRELHAYSDLAATFQVKPRHLFRKETFEFEGIQIPKDFEPEFRMDPVDSKCKYLCIPPDVEEAFLEQSDKIMAAVDLQRLPIVAIKNYYENSKVRKSIESFNVGLSNIQYLVTVDLGLRNDSAALSVFHKEFRVGDDQPKYIQDLVAQWTPDKEAGIIVDLINIEEFISELKNRILIHGVFFDQWNSSLLIQRLAKAGVHSAEYKLDFQDYKNFKEQLYSGNVRLLDYKPQLIELRRLQLKKGNRIDHPYLGSKDAADTVVGAIKILSNTQITRGLGAAFDDGEIIGNNLPTGTLGRNTL